MSIITDRFNCKRTPNPFADPRKVPLKTSLAQFASRVYTKGVVGLGIGGLGLSTLLLPYAMAPDGNLARVALIPTYLAIAEIGKYGAKLIDKENKEDELLNNLREKQIELPPFTRTLHTVHKKAILVLLTTHDPKGGFPMDNQTFDNLKFLNTEYFVQIRLVWAKDQISKDVNELEENEKELHHVLIMGHGNKYSVELADDVRLISSDFLAFQAVSNRKGSILLQSCNTGLKYGAAQMIGAELPGATVYAPSELAYSSNTWVYLTENRRPALFQLNKEMTRVITKIHQGGNAPRAFDIETEMPYLQQRNKSKTHGEENLIKKFSDNR